MNNYLRNKFILNKKKFLRTISIKLLSVTNSLQLKCSLTTIRNESTKDIVAKKIVPTINKSSEINKYLGDYLQKTDHLALLLDYDGTLAPIAPNPKFTIMSDIVRNSLRKLAANPKISLGVISGRGLKDVKSRVGIENIIYSGNHGLEIENPDGTRSDYILDTHLKKTDLVKELEKEVGCDGAWIEDKFVSLTFHYKDVPPESVAQIKSKATKIIEQHKFLAHSAHWAIEAKPPVNWHKGEAIKLILHKNFGNNWDKKIKIIYAGDDTTDEDAMKALKGKGRSIRIAKDPTFKTYGDYLFPNQNMIPQLLKWIENIY